MASRSTGSQKKSNAKPPQISARDARDGSKFNRPRWELAGIALIISPKRGIAKRNSTQYRTSHRGQGWLYREVGARRQRHGSHKIHLQQMWLVRTRERTRRIFAKMGKPTHLLRFAEETTEVFR